MPRCANIFSLRPGRVILVLALYAGLAGIWTWRLQSQPSAPPDDPLRNERLERVARYLGKAPAEVRQALVLSVAMISDEKLAALDEWTRLPPIQQLRQLTVQGGPLDGGGNATDGLLLAWLGQATRIPLVDAHLMIAAAGDRIDDEVKLFAMQALSRRALANAQPQVAAVILERSCELPCASWDTVRSFVNACRAADRPASAIGAVSAWIENQAGPMNAAVIEDARDVEASLLLQAGRAEEALTKQLELLQASDGGAIAERVLDRACVCADAAAQQARLIPWIEQHLAGFPEHRMNPADLMRKLEVHPDYRRWMHRLAAASDRELPVSNAFDACLRLSACGDAIALDRLCVLAVTANREKDAEQHLRVWLKDADRRAAAVGLASRHDLVRRVVAEFLRPTPQDRELHAMLRQL